MNYAKKIIIDEADCTAVEKANYEYTAYKDLISFCMGQGLAETPSYKKEMENYVAATAAFAKAKADMVAKYFAGKNVTDWNLNYSSRELEYNEEE